MLASPFTKALWDARRSLFGWTVAVALVAAMYGAFWPSIQAPEMQKALEAYPEGVLEAFNYDDMTSAAGYLGGSVYGLLVPLLVTIFAIAGGTRAVAGDEEAGTLDLLLAHPVSRVRLAVQRVAALFAGVTLVSVAVGLVIAAMIGPVGFDGISVGDVAAMTVHLILLGSTFVALAFAIGATFGGRGVTLGVSSGVAVLGYLASGLIPQVDGLEWVRDVSPYYWYNGADPLVDGIHPGYALLQLGTAAVLVCAGLLGFTRRDIAT